ncbi:MAG: UDP-glucose/GDP-mannose dehydrogenase family protein [Candidatus Parvarchaeota archaeon]
MNRPSISIFGLGYVGLTFATCLASSGFKVIGYDKDEEKLKAISEGKPPFYEPGLHELLIKAIAEKSLSLVTDPEIAVKGSEFTFIAVGTPEHPKERGVDLSFLFEALQTIAQCLRLKDNWHLIVIRSTIPPGTSRKAALLLEECTGKRCGEDFGLCVNPEFLREGNAIEDTINPDRIIIGEYDQRSGDALESLYKSFHGNKVPPIIRTSLENAELIKYANNAFLAMKVSFINMIANLCEKIPGTDVEEIAKGIGLDKRIGPHFLKAGLGWGGSCFPKDLNALMQIGKQLGVDLPLVKATVDINDQQPYKAIELAEKLIGDLRGKRIAILGLAFKPKTDDIRNAVSIKIINKLLEKGANIIAYDPKAMQHARRIFDDKIRYAKTAIECIKGADCAIIVTEWDEFKNLKPEDFMKNMKNAAIVDGRRIYDKKKMPLDIKYAAIGLGNHIKS